MEREPERQQRFLFCFVCKEHGSSCRRDGGRKEESGKRGEEEEEKEEKKKAATGISWPAAPSGTGHEKHVYSDRKSDSRETARINEGHTLNAAMPSV